jgi:predicted nucleotidyltransferase
MIPELIERGSEIEALCKRFGVRRLEVFGSAVSGAFNADRDLDFLVEFDFPDGVWKGYADRYFGLLESLQQLLGRPVDLVVDSAIKNPYFRESVDRTRVPLYAA